MANAYDNRLVKLSILIDGVTTVYDQNFFIMASGVKYTNGNFGECVIRIDNIAKSARDNLVTKTSQWAKNRTYANITLSVGRESYGTFEIYQGQAVASNPTQPPDIGLIFKSLTQSLMIGSIGTLVMPTSSTISAIANQIAALIPNALTNAPGIALEFNATDRTIGNFAFSGSYINLIKKMNELGGISAFIDNNKLVVTDSNTPRTAVSIQVNSNTGMVGIPEVTEIGARVRMLITNEVRVGDPVTLSSIINPAVNGDYYVLKLSFEVASRETPFYWIMDLKRITAAIGFGIKG